MRSSGPKRISISISRPVFEKLKAYAKITGKPVPRALDALVNDWLDTTGEADIEGLLGVPLPDITHLGAIQPMELLSVLPPDKCVN